MKSPQLAGPNCARHNITALGVRTKCPGPILPTDPLEENVDGDGAAQFFFSESRP